MEINQTKYFIIAAQTQNLTKAAKILSITQSALSKSISNLEDELGVPLFDRAGKRISLNESGKRFLNHAINAVHELDLAVSAALIRDERPILRVGLFQDSDNFMRCLYEFANINQGLLVQIDKLDVSSFAIDTNVYDVLLFPQTPMFRKYRAEKIYSDSYFLAVHQSHELALKESVCLKDLRSQRVIFIKLSDEHFDLPYHLCSGTEIHVLDDAFTNSYEIQRWLISSNRAVGFVPCSVSASYVQDQNIILLPITDEGLALNIMLGFKREKHLSAIGRAFADFTRNYFSL